jgi:toxin ParE1/3/4
MAHRLSLQARADLVEVWEYLYHVTGDASVADRQIDAFIDRFAMLSNWPRMGRARDDLRPGLRSHPSAPTQYSIKLCMPILWFSECCTIAETHER